MTLATQRESVAGGELTREDRWRAHTSRLRSIVKLGRRPARPRVGGPGRHHRRLHDPLAVLRDASPTLIGIGLATAVNGILAIGVTFVIITGGIDLSIGTVMTLSAVMTGVVVTNADLPLLVGIAVGVATGALMGLINGVLIARLGIPPFIATLGMLNVARGLALILAELKPIYFNETPEFNEGAMGSIIPGVDLPNVILVFVGCAIIASFVLGRTILGRYIFAIGSNEEATRLSGVRTVVAGRPPSTSCPASSPGIAGVVIAARLNSAQPAVGFGYELDAIAAAVIGGTSLSGGEGTILGTVIGAFIISMLTNGLRHALACRRSGRSS